jgi:hypothetical protein
MIGETESARPSINLMTATEVGSGGVAAPAHGRTQSRHHAHVLVYRSFPVLALLILPSFLRLWQLDRVGFNSDEAVHSGTAAAMAGNDTLRTMFPIFRAHPLLLQMLLSVWMKGPSDDFATRAVCAMIGVLAPPGGVISYVSGGGGAKLTPVAIAVQPTRTRLAGPTAPRRVRRAGLRHHQPSTPRYSTICSFTLTAPRSP